MKLNREFYEQEDVVKMARQLIGKELYTNFDNELTAGIISETEAYCGRNDRACHANNGKRTSRTETMFGPGGHAYVYLCYGIHHLFNVVTNKEDVADAVLIRAITPIKGEKIMRRRRGKAADLAGGPGKLTRALGITTDHDTMDLCGNTIWIEDHQLDLRKHKIYVTPRIGIDYAGEDAKLPWRFVLNLKA